MDRKKTDALKRPAFSARLCVITGVVMALLCAVLFVAAGRSAVVEIDAPNVPLADIRTVADPADSFFNVKDVSIEGDKLVMTIAPVSRGSGFLQLTDGKTVFWNNTVYVHSFGLITLNTFFGMSTGTFFIPLFASLYLAFLLVCLILAYRRGIKENLYRYGNVRYLAFSVFTAFLLIEQVFLCFGNRGLDDLLEAFLKSAMNFSFVSLPAAFIISLLVTASNVDLMRKEGRTWRNMLGCILGVLICLGTLFPYFLGEWLQRTTVVDVHNQSGAALYIEIFVEAMAGVVVAYLECVFAGTVVVSLKAARRIPAFDKDYIIIHGCQIRKDGGLTKLLKGRVDRAVEFAGMQKKSTGKDIIFIPSGGQGSDEVISEAEAMKRYLLETGVPEERIITEDSSASTRENIVNSADIISGRGGGKAAFSTTNYHVFRTGLLASESGLTYEGIGSPTKSYFWINAFIREFAATIHAERKVHLRAVALIAVYFIISIVLLYISNNV
ncbi:MAG: YdcF family protein [Clostridia bacterium]|nr:YdcF family protein [Clostridia bacterium]